MQQKNRQTQFHFMTFIDELENTEILKELKNTDNAGCLKKKKKKSYSNSSHAQVNSNLLYRF